MTLTKSIHGYDDIRLTEMDVDTIYSINLEANKDYIKRTFSGTVIIFLLLVIADLISQISIDNPVLYYTVIIFSLISISAHLYLYKTVDRLTPETIKRWEIYFFITAFSVASYWAVFSSWGIIHYGMSDVTFSFLLFSAGIGGGAAASNFIWKRVAQLFLAAVLVPPMIILITFQESIIAWGISAGFAIYFLFLFFQVSRSNSEYWKALINTKQLEMQAIELEHANRAKSQFLSSMSHELRTPLTAIIGFGQLLEMVIEEDEQSKKFATQIIDAGDHLLTLINDILDLSAIESGKLSLSTEDVSLKDVFTESLSLMKPLADKRDIHISLPSPQGINCRVNADYMRLKQVLLNLLSNAVKYNRRGGSITFNCEPGPNNKIRMTVTDTGAGMSGSQLQQLFQEFNRVGAEQTKVQGTGIGLVITKRLVELMGGSIGVESQQDKGTTFWIELNQSQHTDPANLEQQNVLFGWNKLDVITSSTSKKILYIEDNPANLLLVTHIIEQFSPHSIISAPDGRLGIDLAMTQHPDLILLDIHLPFDDGYTILKKLRANDLTKNIPVIAVTASAMQSDVKKAKQRGFTTYVTKPINFQILLDAVSAALDEPSH